MASLWPKDYHWQEWRARFRDGQNAGKSYDPQDVNFFVKLVTEKDRFGFAAQQGAGPDGQPGRKLK